MLGQNKNMKKKYVLYPVIVLFLVIGLLCLKTITKKNIIILKDGQAILADDTWLVGAKVFYKNSGRVDFVSEENVEDIRVKYHLLAGKEKISGLFTRIRYEGRIHAFWLKAGGAVFVALVMCIGTFFFFRQFAGTRLKKNKADPVIDAEDSAAELAEYSGDEILAAFFLDIFKYQKGLAKETKAMLRPVDDGSADGKCIYELSVKINHEWDTRRMALGTLRENSASKSKSYYVIYDDHLVVKIPPEPIKEFHEYIDQIKKDGEIAEKLAPKECLVPRVSVILKKVHALNAADDLSPKILEDKYIQLLDANVELQKHLKVGDTFAYFMDLSKYFFLNHILAKMHDIQSKISQELSEHSNIVRDPIEFEARYGLKNAPIYDSLQSIYTEFENSIREILQRNHAESSIQDFQIRNWFLSCLSGEELTAPNFDLKAGIADELNTLAKKLFLESKGPVEAFRKMIKSYVAGGNLKLFGPQLSGIITNLLDLLAWLKNKKVAIRDLKPDNLLVAGDPDKYPQFLESASQYSIGLIDVETAVSYEILAEQKIDQPQLGGTPAYATPSHLFTNVMIEYIFKDLPKTLCLQDWHAVVGIIYKVVTGERLFDLAARILLKLKKEIPNAINANREPAMVLEAASLKYWQSAVAEFETKLHNKKKTLKSVSLVVSSDSTKMLIDEISKVQNHLKISVKKLIESQTVFASDSHKKSLLSAPFAKVSQIKAELSDKKAGSKFQPAERQQAIKLLEELEQLKKQCSHLKSALHSLKKSVPVISCDDLLKCMFYIILVHMHQKPWGTINL